VPAAPQRVADRYEIVGHLGRGGMADVHLAKTVGPGGFERLVVIKRLLPDHREHEEYVRMFLDEARIVARIRHRNVVHVHDLHEHDGQYLLVMEYLDGESADKLIHLDKVDPWVGAYVVSEAAHGLHAAHELRTDDGRLCNVVHRDISPQNIAITYAGEVKLLDFGVARADDRFTRTESGMLKGKMSYMAPEQLMRGLVDRRSDLFALGVVLFELTTGVRLFQRGGQYAVIEAICKEPIPKPSTLDPQYPPALEAIVMRALERDPDARYQTAEQIAHDIVHAMASVASESALRERLARTMSGEFSERRAAKSKLISMSNSPQRTVVFADVFGPQQEIEVEVAERSRTVERQPAAPPSKARSWIMGVVGAAVLLLLASAGAIAGYTAFGAEEEAVPELTNAAPNIERAEPEPIGLAAPPRPIEAPPVVQAARVSIRIATTPPGATVSAPGVESCTSPCALSFAPSSEAVVVTARASRGRVVRRNVTPDRDQDIEIALGRPRREPVGRSSPFEAFE
jgi:serine/threonine protein kinase